MRLSLAAVLLLTGAAAIFAEEPPKPAAAQYSFEQISVPAARGDEPLAAMFSLDKAAKYLDDGATAWSGGRKCVTCHTNGTYLTLRPLLTPQLGPPDAKQRDFAVEQLKAKQVTPRDQLAKSINPAQVIYVAAGLAEFDALGKKISPETAQALKLMFDLQEDGGSWGSLDCWPPYESDAYHLATIAATAAAVAPAWSGTTDDALKSKVVRLHKYLRETPPPHDYSRVLLLWTSTRVPGLLEAARQQEIVDLISKRQRADGGWAMRNFAKPEQWGKGNRAEKIRSEPDFADPASDGHMTGLAVVALRAAGVPKDDPRIVKALAWIKANQRESGRWWTRSLNTDTHHFITYSGTAFPILALAMCDELPQVKP